MTKLLGLFISALLFPIMTLAWGSHTLKPADKLFKAIAQGPRTNFDISGAFNEGMLDSTMTFYAADEIPALQKLIDQIFLDVYQKVSPVNAGFCRLFSDNVEKIQYNLGVSTAAAQKISRICLKMDPSLAVADSREMRSRRQYYFVFNLPQNFPIQSWTNFANQTLIFIDGPLSEEEIYARVLHEIYMGNDGKMDLSPGVLTMYLEPMGPLQLRGDTPADEKLKQFELEHQQRFSYSDGQHAMKVVEPLILGPQAYWTFSLIPLPIIKFSLATLRALSFESYVLGSLFGDPVLKQISDHEIYSLLATEKYAEAFRQMLTVYMPLQDYLLPYEYSLFPLEKRRLYAPQQYLAENQFENIMKIFAESPLTLVDPTGVNVPAGKEVKLLNWLTWPLLNPGASFFCRGPRPRIGSGWRGSQLDDKLGAKFNNGRFDMLHGLLDPSKPIQVVPQKLDGHSLMMKSIFDQAQKLKELEDAQKAKDSSGN